MINHVVKWIWTGKDGKTHFEYRVYHSSNRTNRYNDSQKLPLTVLNFVLNACSCEARYIPENQRSEKYTSLKMETYR